MYHKFEIEKYTVCGNLILPKKIEWYFLNLFCHSWLANLHGFANICKLPVSHTFKDMLRRCGGRKEVWWSRSSVPVSGSPGLGSNLGPGPPHSVV